MPKQDPKDTQRRAQPPGEKARTDTYTMPASDHALIYEIQQRYLVEHQTHVTKSEIVRAGLHALRGMSDKQLLTILKGLVKMKTGRPPKKGAVD